MEEWRVVDGANQDPRLRLISAGTFCSRSPTKILFFDFDFDFQA